MAITRREHGDWAVVTVDGDADFHTAGRLSSAFDEAGTASSWLIVDCAELTFCDSTFIGALVNAYKQVQADGGTLVVAAAPHRLRRLLHRMGLDQVIAAYPSVDDVLK